MEVQSVKIAVLALFQSILLSVVVGISSYYVYTIIERRSKKCSAKQQLKPTMCASAEEASKQIRLHHKRAFELVSYALKLEETGGMYLLAQ